MILHSVSVVCARTYVSTEIVPHRNIEWGRDVNIEFILIIIIIQRPNFTISKNHPREK